MRIMMKSILPVAVVILAVMMLLPSCGAAAMSPTEIAEHIRENVDFSELVSPEQDKIFTSFLPIDEALVKDAAVFVSTQDEKSDEIIVIRFASEADFTTVLSEINAHISARAENFSKHSAAEANKLANVIIRRTDKCIIAVVCEQHKKAAQILDDLKTREVK